MWWIKLNAFARLIFGNMRSAAIYLLDLVNGYLTKPDIAKYVQTVRAKVAPILKWLRDYAKYCPQKWSELYATTLAAVASVCDAFEDGKVSVLEVENAKAAIAKAVEEWKKIGKE